MPACRGRHRGSEATPSALAAPRRAIRKPSAAAAARPGAEEGLSALLGGLSLASTSRSAFWNPSLIEYFERVSAIRADAECLFAQIGQLAEQHARVIAGAGEPTTEMEKVGRADSAVERSASAIDSARKALVARTEARLVELGGDESCVEMRIRRNIDGSVERKLDLCSETLREARQQYSAEMKKEGWSPPVDGSAVWTYEPSHSDRGCP